MPANFSNLRLRYRHFDEDLPPDQQELAIDLSLSSLNFDINHATIGVDTPFTSEFSFDLSIIDSEDSSFGSLRDLGVLLDAHFPASKPAPVTGKKITDEDRVKQITSLFETEIFTDDYLELEFRDINGALTKTVFTGTSPTGTPEEVLTASSSLLSLATHINVGENEVFSLAWQVKVKFHIEAPTTDNLDGSTVNTDSFPQSVVLYPALAFSVPNELGEMPTDPPLNLVKSFNDGLKLNYELTYLPETDSTAPVASPIGKATEELTDSLANLTNTLAANLTSTFKTQLQPAGQFFTDDVALWVLIKKGTDELSFTKFFHYMEAIFCGADNYTTTSDLTDKANQLHRNRSLPFMNVDAYRAVKIATEAFVMVNCMVNRRFISADIEDLRQSVRLVDGVPDETQLSTFFNRYKETVNGGVSMIPYLAVIRRKLSNEGFKNTSFDDAFNRYLTGTGDRDELSCYGLISEKLSSPCFLELIWSYWHEESMMVQGLNAVSRRFQNIRGPGKIDPLANLEIDPLRPLNNLMWGYIQDHQHRLSVRRRAYEYNHHYGITLKGEAAKDMRFADPRSKFIEAFHTLLNLASRFYKQADDMTVQPDGFPILNGLRETHLILSEGAHNQYGDLPSTARAEMLMEQWLLARPEFREFLPTRIMVAYPEPWMDRVAALNQLLGHTKTSVLHFNYLAIFGEKILLSIRFGNWADPSNRSSAAASWANFWRLEIQGYIHSYRAVTGVDLSADGVMAGQRVDAQQPSVHLFRRLAEQQNGNGQMSKTAAAAVVK